MLQYETECVAIGMPIYNGEKYVSAAIKSLLQQTYSNLQIYICDDGSSDATVEICRELAAKDSRITIFENQERQGGARNFNCVFNKTKSKYFMWAAQDDIYAENYIEECLGQLKQSPNAVMCVSEIKFIDEKNRVLMHGGYGRYRNLNTKGMKVADRVYELARRMGWYALYGIIDADVLRKTQLYRPLFGGDVMLMLELLLLGEIVKSEATTFYYRVLPKDKTAAELLNATNHTLLVEDKPYSMLAAELVRIIRAFPEISAVEKKNSCDAILKALLTENGEWRTRIFKEHAKSILLTVLNR